MSNINHVYSLNTTPLTRPPLTRSSNTVESLLSRKRKRPEGVATAAANTVAITANTAPPLLPGQFSFIIRADACHNGPPQAYRSLLSLSRSQLPLTFLDSSANPTRTFSSFLPPLEDGPPEENVDGPKIVIVRPDVHLNGPLYAVERIAPRVYALCCLASWVKLDHLSRLASVSAARQYPEPIHDKDDRAIDSRQPVSWWRSCLVSEPDVAALPSLPSRKAPRLSMCRPPPPAQSKALSHEQTQEMDALQHDGSSPPPTDGIEVEAAVTTPEDVFARFITQYLETLYLSRTPLSFFAKGPVSRARAAFTANQIEPSSVVDLVSFLRTMIQSSSAADKKYKDKLPEMLKKVAAAAVDDDDKSPVKEKKRRKKRKLKPDKYGVFQDEDEFFAKWWHADETLTSAAATAEQSLKKRSAQLRTRETFMQLILVLELMSLEASPEYVSAKEALATAEVVSQPVPKLSQGKPAKSRAKKADDLAVTLELLLDKLGIWHSLDTDMLAEDRPATDKTRSTSNDLCNFCVEVIIPFYLSRCPSHAANVNKKLGGPSATLSKPNSALSKPGEPELRQRPEKKPRKPLHRVATETAAAGSTKGPPTLRHSNTDSQLLVDHIKREASEVPSLSSIPSFRSHRERDSQTPGATSQPPSRRQSGVAGLRAREVDFSALQAAQEAKARKKREVEEKLKDAISGLKRPDRLKAGREVMEVAEQRRLIANGRARGAAGMGGKKSGSNDTAKDRETVVAATPSHGRSQDVVKATPMRIAQPSFGRPNPSFSHAVPSSGPAMIPSSSMKPPPTFSRHDGGGYEAFEEIEEDILVPATGRRQRTVRYEITPSKKTAARDMSPLREADDEEDDEEDDRGHAIAQTPSKPSRSFVSYGTPSKSFSSAASKSKEARSALFSTPAKKAAAVASTATKQPTLVAATHVKPAQVQKQVEVAESAEQSGGQVASKSLYDALGWNDDFSD